MFFFRVYNVTGAGTFNPPDRTRRLKIRFNDQGFVGTTGTVSTATDVWYMSEGDSFELDSPNLAGADIDYDVGKAHLEIIALGKLLT
jgi:hypothetical protein